MLHACFRYEKEAKIDTISISRGSYRIRTQIFFFQKLCSQFMWFCFTSCHKLQIEEYIAYFGCITTRHVKV